MDFKFNFGAEEPSGGLPAAQHPLRGTPESHFAAKKLEIQLQDEDYDEEAKEALFEEVDIKGRTPLKRCRPPNMDTLQGPIASAIVKSDLVPGVYEGGFKVWEGSVDLVEYLVAESVPINGKKVMELGCGHALPGMHAVLEGALVDFQDYNEEVLQEVTAPNVFVNCPTPAHPVGFYSGDWGSLSEIVGTKCYDIILTAETIYEEPAACRLIGCLDDLLRPEGVAYIAAKSYYFGVGGSVQQFEQQVQELLPKRSLERVKLIQDGSSNVREILKLSAEN